MVAPKGEYTPKRGPFAGRTFPSYSSGPGNYQDVRAQWLGFSGYSEERRVIIQPPFKALEARFREVHGVGMYTARRTLGQHWRAELSPADQRLHTDPSRYSTAGGSRKHDTIAMAMRMGLYDSGDDARDDIPY